MTEPRNAEQAEFRWHRVFTQTGRLVHLASGGNNQLGGRTLCGYRVNYLIRRDGPQDYLTMPICAACRKATA